MIGYMRIAPTREKRYSNVYRREQRAGYMKKAIRAGRWREGGKGTTRRSRGYRRGWNMHSPG
jgi:hypothetical protein